MHWTYFCPFKAIKQELFFFNYNTTTLKYFDKMYIAYVYYENIDISFIQIGSLVDASVKHTSTVKVRSNYIL